MDLKKIILSIDTKKYYPHKNIKLFALSILFFLIINIITLMISGFFNLDDSSGSMIGNILNYFSLNYIFMILIFEMGFGFMLFIIEIIQNSLKSKKKNESIALTFTWCVVILILWHLTRNLFITFDKIIFTIINFIIWAVLLLWIGKFLNKTHESK
jgi:hypothetical protein